MSAVAEGLGVRKSFDSEPLRPPVTTVVVAVVTAAVAAAGGVIVTATGDGFWLLVAGLESFLEKKRFIAGTVLKGTLFACFVGDFGCAERAQRGVRST